MGARGIKGSLIGTIVSINPQIFVEFNSRNVRRYFSRTVASYLRKGNTDFQNDWWQLPFPDCLRDSCPECLWNSLQQIFVEFSPRYIWGSHSQTCCGHHFQNNLRNSFPQAFAAFMSRFLWKSYPGNHGEQKNYYRYSELNRDLKKVLKGNGQDELSPEGTTNR